MLPYFSDRAFRDAGEKYYKEKFPTQASIDEIIKTKAQNQPYLHKENNLTQVYIHYYITVICTCMRISCIISFVSAF